MRNLHIRTVLLFAVEQFGWVKRVIDVCVRPRVTVFCFLTIDEISRIQFLLRKFCSAVHLTPIYLLV